MRGIGNDRATKPLVPLRMDVPEKPWRSHSRGIPIPLIPFIPTDAPPGRSLCDVPPPSCPPDPRSTDMTTASRPLFHAAATDHEAAPPLAAWLIGALFFGRSGERRGWK